MGTQKNCLNWMDLLSTQNISLHFMDKKIITFYAQNVSYPVILFFISGFNVWIENSGNPDQLASSDQLIS